MRPFVQLIPFLAAIGLASAPACAGLDATIAQLAKQSELSPLMLIGELHGTRETPALVAQLAQAIGKRKDAAGKAAPVVVALEWNGDQTGHDAYLASEGTDADRKRLLAFPFWTRPFQDGRSSVAMVDLLEALRKQARSGLPVTVATFDLVQGQDTMQRDERMADRLRQIVKAHPQARIIALTGNVHARQRPGAPWDARMRFMAHYLLDLAPFSIDVDASRGSYWACTGGGADGCNAQQIGGAGKPARRSGLYAADARLKAIGYDQGLVLDKLTASPPARAPAPRLRPAG